MNSITNNETNTNGMSICIPRAFANITEARVRKVFEKLGIFRIARVDMIQRKNEKGDAYQRIFVHIQDWTETADAQKARENLLAGKELKIVYDDPWFWKASLNTWAPKPKPETTIYDRKPRIRLEFEDQYTANVNAATALISCMTLEEDRRSYAERRVDPVYCEQDVKSGFIDRKNRQVSRFSNRISSTSTSTSPEERDYRDGSAVIYQKPIVIAQALPEIAVIAKAVEKPAYKMDSETVRLISVFLKINKSDVTEDLYKNNAQMFRDMRRDEILIEEETYEHKALKVDYNGCAPAPKRKQRKILVEEVKKDV